MPELIKDPPKSKIKVWGPLAYVSDEERRRIMKLPASEMGMAQSVIESQLKRQGVYEWRRK